MAREVGDAAVGDVRRHPVDDLDVGEVAEDRVGDDAAHLHRREGVEDEHHHVAGAADAVGDIDRGLGRHGVAVAGDVGDEQRIAAGIHAEDRNAGVLGGLQAGRDLGRIDVDDDRVDLLVDHVLDAADHRRDVALGVDDVDVPALVLRRGLEALDVELGTRLGEIGRDDGNLGLRIGGAGERSEGDRRGSDDPCAAANRRQNDRTCFPPRCGNPSDFLRVARGARNIATRPLPFRARKTIRDAAGKKP